MTEDTGYVASLWRFPVKSMLGERMASAEITEQGILADRAYALVDVETGKVVSAKQPRLWPDLFRCRAEFVEPPRLDAEIPPVRITLPDGSTVTSDSPGVDAVLSAAFGRDVTLASTAPESFTIDQYHPDVAGMNPRGQRDTVVEQALGSAFYAAAGRPSAVAAGSFFDLFPVSVITTATLDHLGALAPESRFDERRFRMNVVVGTDLTGTVENAWPGRTIRIGSDVRLGVALLGLRCVMPALAQEDLPYDTGVLTTLVKHNRLDVGTGSRYPCAGVFAVVEATGTIQPGAPIRVG